MQTVFSLQNKVAIITGHKSGIGHAIEQVFTELGAEVYGFDLPEFDLSKLNFIKKYVDSVISQAERVDILVNNAGVTNIGSIIETPLEEIEHVLTVNLKAPFMLMKEVLPYMLKQKSGVIVNNASDQAFIGKKFSAIYGASKAAIAQLTKSAALDYSPHGIRINCIAPGSTDTKMLRAVMKELHERYPEFYPENIEEFYKNAIPLRRFANPREIANVVAFLASDLSSFMTGAIIPVEGGFVAQ